MFETIPPWHCPTVIRAIGGGSRNNGALANHWKRWDAKPEAKVQICAMLVRLPDLFASEMCKERNYF